MAEDDHLYFSADEAAEHLGVSRTTLYAYVSRKGIRSEKAANAKERRYWKADVLAVRATKGARGIRTTEASGISAVSALTLITPQGVFYRGRSAAELAEHASLETVASLLWNADEAAAFTRRLPQLSSRFGKLASLFDSDSLADRASVLLPVLEADNPRSFDLSPPGMAITGADLVRAVTAVLLRKTKVGAEPIHEQIGKALGLSKEWTDIVRRILVLSADHGFSPSAYAVRAAASVGVTPYRSVAAGLALAAGRYSAFGRLDAMSRFIDELTATADPQTIIVRRLREGEELPGFGGSDVYAGEDPRAQTLLAQLDRMCARDQAFRRLKTAIAAVGDIKGLKPDFALPAMFVNRRVGLNAQDFLWLLGRTVGWVAHSIEQAELGPQDRAPYTYIGELPGDKR
ncbi:MAG: citrate synthase [Pseudomonadota bacterium]